MVQVFVSVICGNPFEAMSFFCWILTFLQLERSLFGTKPSTEVVDLVCFNASDIGEPRKKTWCFRVYRG